MRSFLTLTADAVVDGGQSGPFGENSRPHPEEGRRLMRAFLRIKEARLREALVNLVEELSVRQTEQTDIRQTGQMTD